MKKIFLLSTILLSSFVLNAQEIKVIEDKEKIADEKHPVLTVIIYNSEASAIEKEWKSLMKDYNAKVSSKAEIFADNASITSISMNTMDIYAFTSKVDEGVKLVVGFDLGGAYISESTHKPEFNAAEKILRQFAVDISKKGIQNKIDIEKATQTDLESDLAELKKKNEKLHKDIEEYKQKIANAEEDLVINEKDQTTKTSEIETQKKVVEEIQKKLDEIK